MANQSARLAIETMRIRRTARASLAAIRLLVSTSIAPLMTSATTSAILIQKAVDARFQTPVVVFTAKRAPMPAA